ncbi:hydantoinase/carbamoylase family amidase [Tropicimonas isoalkanivorans]|uniref:N-carbamoyl-L-amino-acid hydrolase n=1 Tax=Tropicimonas isoalkanivorans TaxID=441112 RepID=A0A1I1HWA1_9RHOB|nr:hydantoinase/carbamoylase family amidase [Tropicimonas isoalkanivorans]SFC25723.1 N-carbamoyl-L-amino-acid hydrolase [Tropicimonas isoalkanivorans]
MPQTARTDKPARPALHIAERFLKELAQIRDPKGGVRRDSYGDGEAAAHEIFRRFAEDIGLRWHVDAACNAYARYDGADPTREFIIGSHLDSVPAGGNYDGAAGVAMGLAVLGGMIEAGITPATTLTVMATRAEESTWFNASYIGSRAMLGTLAPSELDEVIRADTGLSLGAHIRAAGGDPSAIRFGAPLIDTQTLTGFLEPHIEQGPVLVADALPMAVVTGIRGSFRYREASCAGIYAHSGATPRSARKDAVVGTALLVSAMEDYWQKLEATGEDLTITFGKVFTDPAQHAFSKVPGRVDFCLDVRSASRETLDRVHDELMRQAAAISQRCGVRFDFGQRTGSEPAVLSGDIASALEASCDARSVPVRRMASGAGHDAAAFAAAGVPSAMVFIRNENGSHNPDESMNFDDFADATEAVFDFCLNRLP